MIRRCPEAPRARASFRAPLSAVTLLSVVAALIFMGGCASKRITELRPVAEADTAQAMEMLMNYNGVEGQVRVLGSVYYPDKPGFDFGARAEQGVGVRLDGVAGPTAKVLFSLGCLASEGCTVYLPGRREAYFAKGELLAGWVASLVSGRVAVLGEPAAAWRNEDGKLVLELRRAGRDWQRVELDPESGLVHRSLYGDEGEEAQLEIVYGEFAEVGGDLFPHKIMFGGVSEGEELYFDIERIERSESSGAGVFGLKLPERVVQRSGDGGVIWRKMGLFWFPEG